MDNLKYRLRLTRTMASKNVGIIGGLDHMRSTTIVRLVPLSVVSVPAHFSTNGVYNNTIHGYHAISNQFPSFYLRKTFSDTSKKNRIGTGQSIKQRGNLCKHKIQRLISTSIK